MLVEQIEGRYKSWQVCICILFIPSNYHSISFQTLWQHLLMCRLHNDIFRRLIARRCSNWRSQWKHSHYPVFDVLFSVSRSVQTSQHFCCYNTCNVEDCQHFSLWKIIVECLSFIHVNKKPVQICCWRVWWNDGTFRWWQHGLLLRNLPNFLYRHHDQRCISKELQYLSLFSPSINVKRSWRIHTFINYDFWLIVNVVEIWPLHCCNFRNFRFFHDAMNLSFYLSRHPR